MQFVDFKKSLQEKIQPVYIIGGNEFYLVTNALNNLISACNITVPEMNITYIDEQIALDDIFVMCETLPFLSSKRMIIVKNYALDNNSLTKIKEYLKNYNATTCLVFTTSSSINDNAIPCVDCSNLAKATLASKINIEAKNANCEIQPPALIKLMEYCSYSITACMNELEKLLSYCKDKNVITKEDVEQVCYKQEQEINIFDLTNAISKKDKTTAFSIVKRLIDSENQKSVTSLLYTHYRRLFLSLASKRLSDEQLAKILGVKPYAINVYRTQAKALGSEKILNSMNMLTKIDTATKSSFTNLDEELYLFLLYTLS